jgi:hypothetical protein
MSTLDHALEQKTICRLKLPDGGGGAGSASVYVATTSASAGSGEYDTEVPQFVPAVGEAGLAERAVLHRGRK